METGNFEQTLEVSRSGDPFRPFTVALVNGDRFEVDHPGALAVRDGIAMYIGAGGARSSLTTKALARSSAI